MAASNIQPHANPDARLVVQLHTADDCVGTFSLTCDGDDRLQTGIVWQPGPPARETTQVTLLRSARGADATEQLRSGEEWRALEDSDLEDEFLDRVLRGADAAAITAELLSVNGVRVGQKLLISKVSSVHGFDDYNVTGHPEVHRFTVGHRLQPGDKFNLYCRDGRKVGGTWAGSLEASLKRSLKRLASK